MDVVNNQTAFVLFRDSFETQSVFIIFYRTFSYTSIVSLIGITSLICPPLPLLAMNRRMFNILAFAWEYQQDGHLGYIIRLESSIRAPILSRLATFTSTPSNVRSLVSPHGSIIPENICNLRRSLN
ncbi:hypothetical protein PM082_020336 [Marasmius tenuissimus]|nr:hypothetical protein PM082_020336 [Marasmius tenuissimus]